MALRMLRYELPVDGEPHTYTCGGEPLRVEAVNAALVEFWTLDDVDGPLVERTLQVFGTGHPIPTDATWRGTSARTREGLVWHLFELPDPREATP